MRDIKWLPILLIVIAGCLGDASSGSCAESGLDAQSDPLFQQASKSISDGKYDEAIASLSQLLLLNPSHGNALWSRGQLYLNQKKYALAEADFRQVVTLIPAVADAHGSLAWVLILQGKAKDALEPAIKAHELNEENFSWINNLGHAYLLNNDELKANNYYLQAVKLAKEKSEFDAMLDDLKAFIQNGLAVEASKRAMAWVENLYANREELKQADDQGVQVAQLYNEGKYTEAIPLAIRRVETYKKLIGERHSSYAGSLSWLASLYRAAGEYAKALPLFRQASDVYRATLGEGDVIYASNLGNLAELYRDMGDYPSALPLYQKTSAIDKKILGENHADFATDLHNLALCYSAMGDYDKALPLYQQALAIYKKTLGESHPNYATSLNSLAVLYFSMGDYTKALQMYRQVLEIRETILGKHHQHYAVSLNNLAGLYESMGDYASALPLYQQSLAIRKDTLGEMHPDYAVALNNLAGLYGAMGDYAKELPLYQQAQEINKKTLGEAHPSYAVSLNNLAELYFSIGDYALALPLYKQALLIRKESLGEMHPLYAVSLNNLAALYHSVGERTQALLLYKQALEIRKNALGERHPDYAQSLNNLAFEHQLMGDFAQAMTLSRQALEIRKETLGEQHPDYADSLNNLAALYDTVGDDYAKALSLYQQALKIRKKTFGDSHPLYAESLNNLAFLQGDQGHYTESLALFLQGQEVASRGIDNVFAIGTEQQKLQFVLKQDWSYHGTLSLIHRRFANDEKALHSALDLVLSRKGIVFDAQARQSEAIARSLDPESKKLWDELSSQRTLLSKLLQSKPEKLSAEEYQKHIAQLQARIASLEGQVSSKSSLLAEQLKQRRVVNKKVAAQLGKDGVLAEFVRIHDYDWDHGKWSDSWRYLAFILKGNGSVKLVDLGDAEQLEQGVRAALKPIGIVGGDTARQADATRSLYDLLWQPLAAAVGNVGKVVFSPDGLLNLVPFAAMQDQDGHYLIESKQIAYVTSGRDLTRGDLGFKPESELYLAANPQFDLTAQISAGTDDSTHGAVRSAGFDMHFSALPGTAEEARHIPHQLSGKQTVLTGAQATEESVLNIRRPRVMHLATHGFFLADQSGSAVAGTRGAEAFMANANSASGAKASALPKGYENPLVRSGLAFAGANHAGEAQGGRDGLLTALEVSGMDLHGTDLVTLSACETGRGEIKSGEGVFGLRRAFALAGTAHLMMSLWPVSDEVTAKQMKTFYALYGKRTAPAVALRQAQLATIAELRSKKGQAEPALWAPFIVQGW